MPHQYSHFSNRVHIHKNGSDIHVLGPQAFFHGKHESMWGKQQIWTRLEHACQRKYWISLILNLLLRIDFNTQRFLEFIYKIINTYQNCKWRRKIFNIIPSINLNNILMGVFAVFVNFIQIPFHKIDFSHQTKSDLCKYVPNWSAEKACYNIISSHINFQISFQISWQFNRCASSHSSTIKFSDENTTVSSLPITFRLFSFAFYTLMYHHSYHQHSADSWHWKIATTTTSTTTENNENMLL